MSDFLGSLLTRNTEGPNQGQSLRPRPLTLYEPLVAEENRPADILSLQIDASTDVLRPSQLSPGDRGSLPLVGAQAEPSTAIPLRQPPGQSQTAGSSQGGYTGAIISAVFESPPLGQIASQSRQPILLNEADRGDFGRPGITGQPSIAGQFSAADLEKTIFQPESMQLTGDQGEAEVETSNRAHADLVVRPPMKPVWAESAGPAQNELDMAKLPTVQSSRLSTETEWMAQKEGELLQDLLTVRASGAYPPLPQQMQPLPAPAGRADLTVAAQQPIPTIQVTIGRIEVRAFPPAAPQGTKAHQGQPLMTLEEYLRLRDGGRK